MAIITKITTQQKIQGRYNIFMDFGKGEEFAFSVDEDVLIKFNLKKGLELEDFSLMEIHFQDDIRKAYNKAILYLTKRIRSEKEIVDYLQKNAVEEAVINEVIHKLKSQKYIDDDEYAGAYTRTQLNTTDKGPELIRRELIEKGIDQGTIGKALEQYTIDSQLEKAMVLCDKFIQKSSKDSSKIVKQKLENLLLRKGHLYTVIHTALSETDFEKQAESEAAAIQIQAEKIHRKFGHLPKFEYEQKMKQALYRKGFSLELIEKILEEIRIMNE